VPAAAEGGISSSGAATVVESMTVAELFDELRKVMQNYPGTAGLPVRLVPHGHRHIQEIEGVYPRLSGTAVVIEAQR
jgi:hypothetical protein